jgi:CspA family cold shock protein
MILLKGTVKWFDSQKGYGFIEPEDGSKDVFVHYSGIRGTGYRSLEEGDEVDFEIEQDQRGPKAVDVIKL